MLLASLWPLPAQTNNRPSNVNELLAGDAHLAVGRNIDALICYQKAAQVKPDGAMRAGRLLLFGKTSNDAHQTVAPDPGEGIRWTFWAATNRNAGACLNLATAFEWGMGLKTNLVLAYAWYRVAKEIDAAIPMEPLDQLATRLDPQEIQLGQEIAKQYCLGDWPSCPVRKLVRGDPRFTLNGISAGGRTPLAVINKLTIAQGETSRIISPKGSWMVACVEVNATSVTIEVTDENEAHLLTLP